MRIVKAHAYGNDFLYLERRALSQTDGAALARRVCHRHTGLGADGLILFERTARGASMQLVNSDGSPSEVSGNGLRGLAAVLAWEAGLATGRIVIDSDAGQKDVEILSRDSATRFTMRTTMGVVRDVGDVTLEVEGVGTVEAVRLNVGNPQCVVLTDRLDETVLHRIGPALQRSAAFPAGVNVELACVRSREHIDILIWERGCGPTLASGTGACASALAARFRGRVDDDVTVESAGGRQRVRMDDTGAFWLTGAAEILATCDWLSD